MPYFHLKIFFSFQKENSYRKELRAHFAMIDNELCFYSNDFSNINSFNYSVSPKKGYPLKSSANGACSNLNALTP